MAFDALMILGPTASGKTALSLSIASELPAEVISVDSALVYRGMDIGTAKPTEAERGGVPHHLIDIRDIGEPYNVAQPEKAVVGILTQRGAFKRMALSEVGQMSRARRGLLVLRELKRDPHRIVAP